MKQITPILLFALILTIALPLVSMAQSADELFSYANNLQRDGLFEAASQQYLRFAMDHPNDTRAPDALMHAADCLAKIGSNEEAVTVLTSLVDTYGSHPDICAFRIKLAKFHQQMRDFEKAFELFTEIVTDEKDCPQITEAIVGRGESLLALKRYEEARAVFSDMIATYGDNSMTPRAYFGLARATAGLGKTEEALAAYRRLGERFSRHPLSAFAFLEVARLSIAAGDSTAAVDAYTNAKRFTEKAIFIPACTEGARLLEGMGRYDAAYDWYRELLLRPDLDDPAPVYESAARAAYYAGDYVSVKNLALRFAQNQEWGVSPAMLLYEARAQLKLSEFEQALENARTLETRLKESQEAVFAPMIKGEALLGQGRAREAIGEMRRFISAVPDSARKGEALTKIADVYMTSLGDTTKALDVLQERIEVEKRRNPSSFLEIAALYERTGAYKEARRVYTEIVDTFPFSDAEATAESRLNYIDAFAVLDPSSALREMEQAAREILSLPQSEGMLVLAETRMANLKDFAGALTLAEQAFSSATVDSIRAKALYIKGRCHAGMARRAAANDDGELASRELASAKREWQTLLSDFADSPWAGRSAFETLFLETAVTGATDTLALQQAISRYPRRPESATAYEMLGDALERVPGSAGQRATCYRQALGAADQLEDASRVRLKLSEVLYDQGDFENSMVLSRAALEDPRRSVHLKAAYQTARSLRKLQRYGEARTLFMEVAEGDPEGGFGAAAELQAADCLYMVAEYDAALDAYSAVLKRATTNRLVWETTYRLALCLDKMGEQDEALGLLQNCLRSPHGGSLRINAYEHALEMARSLGLAQREGSLLERFAAEVDTTDRALEVREKLMRWYLKHERYDAALDLSQTMVASSGDSTAMQAQAFRAMSLYRAGRLEEARVLHERMRAQGAPPALLWEVALHASWYYFSTKQYAQCIATAQPLMENCPGGAPCDDALFLLTMGLFNSNKISEAGDRAKTFFEQFPLSPHAPAIHLKFGNALAARNQYAEALGHYQQAAATANDSSVVFDSMQNLAISYQKLSKWKEAASVWDDLLERFPDSSYAGEASLNAARCRMEGGDLRAAALAYHDAIPHLDKKNKARAYYWSGECYQRMRDYKSAIAEYLKVPYLVPEEAMWAVTAQLKAAECYVSINRIESAKNIYQQVVNRYGANSDWGKGAAAALEKLDAAAPPGEEQPEGSN